MSALMGVMRDPNNNDITVTGPDPAMGNVNSTFRVISGVGLACADRGYWPVFLSRTPAGSGTANLKTFDPNSFAYMCLRARDPNDMSQTKWFCGQGVMADGVTGYAVLNGKQSARSICDQLAPRAASAADLGRFVLAR
ncbi:MAG TPA: hypothetical protein VFH51_00750, partial [Myxococcota bacterium]|nr:hypothetical protein [Myxococcota bacterium]